MAERRPKDPAPWMPAEWTEEDVGALQGLQRGDASPDMQQRALKFIIEKVCETYGLGWSPTGPHEASFAAGRRFAGMQVVKCLNLNLQQLKRRA